jgi:hypothetical protein
MLALRDCAAQNGIKYGGIKDMPKEMRAERPTRAYLEVGNAENQRNDEQARGNEQRLPGTVAA